MCKNKRNKKITRLDSDNIEAVRTRKIELNSSPFVDTAKVSTELTRLKFWWFWATR